jgi:hypothetical protein
VCQVNKVLLGHKGLKDLQEQQDQLAHRVLPDYKDPRE